MSTAPLPSPATIAAELARTLPSMRFYADKNSDITRVEILNSAPAIRDHADVPDIDIIIAEVHTPDSTSVYQLPIAWAHSAAQVGSTGRAVSKDRSVAKDRAAFTDRAAFIDRGAAHLLVNGDGVIGFDALCDADCVTALAQKMITDGHLGQMSVHRVAGAELTPPHTGRPMGVEQSNTSVIFDDAVMCKFFRRLHRGTNADVELLAALSTSNCDSVPHLFGWLELSIDDGEPFTTAMLQEFVPNSVDGWAMALTSVRDVISDPLTELHALGTDFHVEAHQLGQAVAEVHAHLAAALPAKRHVSGDELVAPMRERLAFVARHVPDVAARADAAERVYAAAAAAVDDDGIAVQRIHGDLHLGQVLRTPRNWLLIDFEGEPSRPWEERRLPDHPLRDVAGMIRSFDYAAHFPLLTGRDDSATARKRVEDWATRNIDSFLRGYSQVDVEAPAPDSPSNPDKQYDSRLIDAFVLDKAIYECLYEAQNRPDWLALPLAAVQRLLDK